MTDVDRYTDDGAGDESFPTDYCLLTTVYFVMSEHGKCPMGKHPWLATFFALTFLLVFLAHKLGLL